MKKQALFVIGAVLILAFILAACTPAAAQPAAAQQSAAQTTFTDPFAYCKAVGKIDAPDARYTGDKVPDTIMTGYLKAANIQNSTEPSDVFKKATVWRCMDSQVYACNFGANLPCESKANTNKTPTQEMNDFCKANPGSDFIPMAVTGHDTVYSWKCNNGTAEVGDQFSKVDAAGYIENIWYKLEPGS